MFVLDEADEMLSRGFKDQIYEIFLKLPPNAQVKAEHVFLTETKPIIILKFSETLLFVGFKQLNSVRDGLTGKLSFHHQRIKHAS